MNPISELFEFLKNYPELFAAFLGSDKEQAIKNVQEGARVAGKTLTEDEAEERLKKIVADPLALLKKYDEVSDDLVVCLAMFTALKLTRSILNCQWQILESGSNRVFVTSDNPVSYVLPDDMPMEWEMGSIVCNSDFRYLQRNVS